LALTKDGRRAFDADTAGNVAPETVVVTSTSLARMLSAFSGVKISRTNIGDQGPLKLVPRNLRTAIFGPWLGLDLYAMVTK
jgi:hypothetical protein